MLADLGHLWGVHRLGMHAQTPSGKRQGSGGKPKEIAEQKDRKCRNA